MVILFSEPTTTASDDITEPQTPPAKAPPIIDSTAPPTGAPSTNIGGNVGIAVFIIALITVVTIIIIAVIFCSRRPLGKKAFPSGLAITSTSLTPKVNGQESQDYEQVDRECGDGIYTDIEPDKGEAGPYEVTIPIKIPVQTNEAYGMLIRAPLDNAEL